MKLLPWGLYGASSLNMGWTDTLRVSPSELTQFTNPTFAIEVNGRMMNIRTHDFMKRLLQQDILNVVDRDITALTTTTIGKDLHGNPMDHTFELAAGFGLSKLAAIMAGRITPQYSFTNGKLTEVGIQEKGPYENTIPIQLKERDMLFMLADRILPAQGHITRAEARALESMAHQALANIVKNYGN